MKRNFARLVAVLVSTITITMVMFFTACDMKNGVPDNLGDIVDLMSSNPTDGTTASPGELDHETELRIRQALFKILPEYGCPEWLTVESIVLRVYLGTYNGAVVGIWRLPVPSTDMMVQVWVDGIEFAFSDGGTWVTVWKDEYIYAYKDALQKAYDDKILTRDEIQKIHDFYYQNK